MFLPHEKGQSLVEYALIIVLIVVLVGSALCALGGAAIDVIKMIQKARGG